MSFIIQIKTPKDHFKPQLSQKMSPKMELIWMQIGLIIRNTPLGSRRLTPAHHAKGPSKPLGPVHLFGRKPIIVPDPGNAWV